MFLCLCYQNEFGDVCILSSGLFQVNCFGISLVLASEALLFPFDSVSGLFSLLS